MISSPLLDQAAVEQLRVMTGGDTDLLQEFLDLFDADSNALLSRVDQALRTSDAEEIRKAAHALKGGSANIGGKRLSEMCLQLETQGRQGNLEGASLLVEQIRRVVEETQIALKTAFFSP